MNDILQKSPLAVRSCNVIVEIIFSLSCQNFSASASVTRVKEILDPGLSCPRMSKSALITWAILGYPPIVWPSTPSTNSCPSRATWIVPGQTGSESISCLGVGKDGPDSRRPIRLLDWSTRKSLSNKVDALKEENSAPCVTLIRPLGACQRHSSGSRDRMHQPSSQRSVVLPLMGSNEELLPRIFVTLIPLWCLGSHEPRWCNFLSWAFPRLEWESV